jgi:anti-sigma factor RsiW
MSTAGACSDWELVLHAFFDGELDAADSLACELHLGRCQRCSVEMKNLKSMRQKFGRSAIGWAARCLAKSNWLVALSERPLQILAEERASSGAIVFDIWTEESTGRTNCIFWE